MEGKSGRCRRADAEDILSSVGGILASSAAAASSLDGMIKTPEQIERMRETCRVEYYGTPVNLKTIAQINTPDATSLLIQPYDKSCLKLIEKAIVAANIGVTPSNDGEVIRVAVPPLTSARRKAVSTEGFCSLSREVLWIAISRW